MAIFDLHLKTILRADGSSSVGAAAYRAGACLTDERTGEIHDYSRRPGIVSEIILPQDTLAPAHDQNELRSLLWNKAERAERRKNSVLAREIVAALPCELSSAQCLLLVQRYVCHLVDRIGVAVDFAIHPPSRGGDQRNRHVHILFTTRRIEGTLVFGAKTRELDVASTGGPIISSLREMWADQVNSALRDAGRSETISHLSLADRGIEREPKPHLGPVATHMARALRRQARDLLAEADALEANEREKAGAASSTVTTNEPVIDKGAPEIRRSDRWIERGPNDHQFQPLWIRTVAEGEIQGKLKGYEPFALKAVERAVTDEAERQRIFIEQNRCRREDEDAQDRAEAEKKAAEDRKKARSAAALAERPAQRVDDVRLVPATGPHKKTKLLRAPNPYRDLMRKLSGQGSKPKSRGSGKGKRRDKGRGGRE